MWHLSDVIYLTLDMKFEVHEKSQSVSLVMGDTFVIGFLNLTNAPSVE